MRVSWCWMRASATLSASARIFRFIMSAATVKSWPRGPLMRQVSRRNWCMRNRALWCRASSTAKPMTRQTFSDNAEEIARLLRRFHETMAPHVSGAGFIFWVFHVIRDYAKTLAAGNSRMSDQAAPVSGTCRGAGKGAGTNADCVWSP